MSTQASIAVGSIKLGPALAGIVKAWFIPFDDKHMGGKVTL